MSVMTPAALTGAQYEIAGGDYLAVVTELGAGLRALRHRDRPLITGYNADELPPHRLAVLRRFFQDYKQLEYKAVEVDEITPAEKAYPIIEEALHRYSTQRRRGFQSPV